MGEIIPRLCGGTFFNLLLRNRIKKNSPNQGDCFNALMKIYDPNFIPVTGTNAKTIPSRFRNCDPELNTDYIKFGDSILSKAFTERMNSSYPDVLAEMKKFIDGSFRVDESGKWLISALLELIEDDTFIGAETRFHINPNNGESYKRELPRTGEFYFYSFLLGIWYYICTNEMDPGVGRETYFSWTREGKTENSEREFTSEIGLHKYQDIDVSYSLKKEHLLKTAATPAEVIQALHKQQKTLDRQSVDIPESEASAVVVEVAAPRRSVFVGKYDHYLEQAKKKHSFKETFLYKKEKEFYSFYVCNDLCPVKDRPIRFFDQVDAEEAQDTRISDVSFERFLPGHNFIHIVGSGGLGKSMMMNHLMLDTIKRYGSSKVPIFITLRNYNSERCDLLDFIFSEFQRHDRQLTLSDLTDLMGCGSALLLMDGLDEIKSGQRAEFDRQFELLLDQFSSVNCIISSRPGVRISSLAHFDQYRIQPLTLEQAVKMIEKLDKDTVSEEVKTDFINGLRRDLFNLKRDEKHQFIGNPLFLTIMLTTYKYYHDIPSKRYLFYEHAYEAMAETFDATTKSLHRDFDTGLDSREFKKFFGAFCALTYNEEKYSFSEDELLKYAQNVIDESGYECRARDFLADITEKICLLYLDGTEYRFIHRSFQEYFAAYFFSIQLENSFDAILEMFIEKDTSSADDQTLEMLYGIDDKKTIVCLLIPFLRRFFEKEEPDGYRDFLQNVYLSVSYTGGEVNEFPINAPYSNLYKLTCKVCGIDPEFFLDDEDIPYEYNFIAEKFRYYNPNWREHRYAIHEGNITAEKDIPKSDLCLYYSEEEEEEPDGCIFEINFDDFYGDDRYTYYPEIAKAIESDNFKLRQLFRETKEALSKLEDRYAKKDKPVNFLRNFR